MEVEGTSIELVDFSSSDAKAYSHSRLRNSWCLRILAALRGMFLAQFSRGKEIITTGAELLRAELDFIEQGGYGRSVRTPWQSKSIFQDSLSCLNYGDPKRAHPCNECHLLEFVSAENKTQAVPCHFIPLNADGEPSRS